MSHIPVNHRLQPWYRALAGLAGLYVLVFGIVGAIRASGESFFERGSTTVFGLHLNMAFAILSIVAGVVLFGGAVVGRNLDHFINLGGAGVFMVSGLVMLLLLRTDANFLNFRMATCVMSFIIGTVLFAAGLYGRVDAAHVQAREEHFRHGGHDPVAHSWAFSGAPEREPEDDPDGHRFG